MNTTDEQVTHQEWQERRAAVAADHEPGWEVEYEPGSFGCHELLDRVSLLGDMVEGQLLEHPTCVLNAEWYRLAAQAVTALRELYQRVGAEHLPARGPQPPRGD